MVDTIKFKPERTVCLRRFDEDMERLPPEWDRFESTGRAKGYPTSFGRLHHRATGVRIHHREGVVLSLEFSIPRLLRGNNGQQVLSQEQLDDGIAAGLKVAQEVIDGIVGMGTIQRLDLVINLRGDPRWFCQMFVDAAHPWIYTETRDYNGVSLVFPGRKCRILFYDKCRQMRLKTSGCVRIEVQLKSTALIARAFSLPEGETLRTLSFSDSYLALSYVLGLFDSISYFPPTFNESGVIALCDRAGVTVPGGLSVFGWWATGKKPKTVRRKQAAVFRAKLELEKIRIGFSLENLLPPTSIPATVDVLTDGTLVDQPPQPIVPPASAACNPVRFGCPTPG